MTQNRRHLCLYTVHRGHDIRFLSSAGCMPTVLTDAMHIDGDTNLSRLLFESKVKINILINCGAPFGVWCQDWPSNCGYGREPEYVLPLPDACSIYSVLLPLFGSLIYPFANEHDSKFPRVWNVGGKLRHGGLSNLDGSAAWRSSSNPEGFHEWDSGQTDIVRPNTTLILSLIKSVLTQGFYLQQCN